MDRKEKNRAMAIFFLIYVILLAFASVVLCYNVISTAIVAFVFCEAYLFIIWRIEEEYDEGKEGMGL